jgi:ABC-type glycerol-3-phosphate transport system substrate-binding protein
MSLYFESAWKGAGRNNGKFYGVPTGIYADMLYYNKDLFDAAGVPYPSGDWNKPITIEELADIAKKVTSGSGAEKVYGFGMIAGLAHLSAFMVGNGGFGMYYPNGKCAIGQPESLQVFKVFAQMAAVDQSMVNASALKVMGPPDLFMNGRLAMYVDGIWRLTQFNKITKFRPGLAAIPAKPGKAATISFLDQWLIMNGSRKKDGAWETVKALFSDEALAIIAKHQYQGFPISQKVFSETLGSFVQGRYETSDLESLKGAFDHLLSVDSSPKAIEYSARTTAEWDQMLLGTKSPEDAVAAIVKIVDDANSK